MVRMAPFCNGLFGCPDVRNFPEMSDPKFHCHGSFPPDFSRLLGCVHTTRMPKEFETHQMFSVHTTPEKCFCDGSVWTVGQRVEIKMRCQISPALCGRELRRKDSIPFNLVPRPFSLGTRLHPFFIDFHNSQKSFNLCSVEFYII